MSSLTPPLPLVLCGPILRRTLQSEVCFWLVTTRPIEVSCHFYLEEDTEHPFFQAQASDDTLECVHLRAGTACHVYIITVEKESGFPQDTWISYDLMMSVSDVDGKSIYATADWACEDFTYAGYRLPRFVIASRLTHVLHGSCRKPHHASPDGLVRADNFCAKLLENSQLQATDFPELLVLSGDQIYVDDVAGPMLEAIHQIIELLGFTSEPIEHPSSGETMNLYATDQQLYARDQLLPDTREQTSAYDAVFGGARKPIFTSVNAKNHLVTLAEMISMYLLVWSPVCWQFVRAACANQLSQPLEQRYQRECQALEGFQSGLPAVRRLLAHVPVAMIFDDHDVTDDWNLTAAWEQAAYGNPFSRRIIGNALIGYLLCQGWGNAPKTFASFYEPLQGVLASPGQMNHDELIEQLLHFPNWDYIWSTQPALMVLDSRTQRWRSERSPKLPSGLLDWESLCHLQQQLIDHDAVIMVAPAPVFGIKLIEAIQRVMTWLGHPLMVDAENWMAHPGTASTLINMFCHAKTPRHFIILSGDVHYSFVYRVKIRGHHYRDAGSPTIWQITSSGLRNEFPRLLLDILDRANRWLYSPKSPLNWFTKRRKMRVTPYIPSSASKGERIVNRSGIGLLKINPDGTPTHISQLVGHGEEITFESEH